MLTSHCSSILSQLKRWLLSLFGMLSNYMDFLVPLLVIVTKYFLADFGQSYFGCRVLLSTIVPHIIRKRMDKRKWSTVVWRHTFDVFHIASLDVGLHGFLGQNTGIIPHSTPPLIQHRFEQFTSETHHH